MYAQLASLPSPASPEQVMRAAGIAHAMGDYWRAAEYLQAVLSADPGNRSAKLRLADTLERLVKLDRAEAIYAQLRMMDPTDAQAYLGLASIEMERGRQTAAWKWLSDGSRACVANSADEAQIARRYEDWDDLKRAEAVLLQAERGAPDDEAIQIQHANLLLRMGRYAQVRAIAERLLQRNPLNAPAAQCAVRYYEAAGAPTGDSAAMAAAAEKCAKLNNTNPSALFVAGNVFKRAGQLHHAAQAYAAAIARNPYFSGARYALASIFARLGQRAQSDQQMAVFEEVRQREDRQRTLETAVTHRPTAPALHAALAQFLESVGDYPSAVREYQAAAGLAPNDMRIRRLLASIYSRLGWGRPPATPR